MQKSWSLFCRIVDNFGDIGVTWRVANQLRVLGISQISLWIDELEIAKKIIPNLNPELDNQVIDGLNIHRWQPDLTFNDVEIADVVIEMFACDVPASYIEKMAIKKPCWINLEYLSAEKWIETFHLKTSVHPQTGLIKTFFFPGFTAQTGGLPREIKDCENPDISVLKDRLIEYHFPLTSNRWVISLFYYANANVEALLSALYRSKQPIHVMIPSDIGLAKIAQFFSVDTLNIGQTLTLENLSVSILPFLSQAKYDELLRACDINFVRGEDSWVRGLMAGKPLVWQPYIQENETHLTKLQAFEDLYEMPISLRNMHDAWSTSQINEQMVLEVFDDFEYLLKHARDFKARMCAQTSLASNLVHFVENGL
jgi:uncharacterized repeat protein (TIGR03837 family)